MGKHTTNISSCFSLYIYSKNNDYNTNLDTSHTDLFNYSLLMSDYEMTNPIVSIVSPSQVMVTVVKSIKARKQES